MAPAKRRRRVDWERETLAPFVAKVPERRAEFRTVSGRVVRRLAAPEDWRGSLGAPGKDVAETLRTRLGFPGTAPYARGVQPTMYRGRPWTMRQYAGFGSAEASNARYRYLLAQGTTGLSVAFDLPTQTGLDPDAPMAEGEVGRTGVSIATLDDMAALFDGIPLDKVSTSMTINAPASVLLALYVAVGRRQGVAPSALSGTVQNDILKEYIARGTYIYPPGPSLRLTTDILSWCAKEVPRWNTISVSGYHIREAGATAVQELAFTLADAIAYVQAALEAGLAVDDFAPRVSFFFNAHNDLFEEVAKFRAARRMWHGIMTERFDAKDPRSTMLRFHAQTAGASLTAQQPENNVVRVAVQALAAVLGGTQSLHTNSFDEALALPTEKAARIALRTQQILAEESGVAATIDPVAGSWYLESLTDEMQAEAEGLIDRIDRMGGMLKAIENGWVQNEIHESAYAFQRAVEAKEAVIVGVNDFTAGSQEPHPDLLRVDPSEERRQRERVAGFRKGRDGPKARKALEALRAGAEGTENLMPIILAAVEARATLGEVCGTLKEVFGEHVPAQWDGHGGTG